MKKVLIVLTGLMLLNESGIYAGNKDRQGEAGAPELLLNPWAQSSGWGGLNTACVHGLEALNLNAGGLAFAKGTQLEFAHTNWLQGTGITFNTFGFAQQLGQKGGVIAADVMSISMGDIPITTVDLPEGGIGTYTPQFINIALAYSKVFSNSIYGGIVVRGVSEGISDVKAQGFGIDAGVQYVTGPSSDPQRVKFGIALRNIGTPMTFGGDGLSFNSNAPQGDYSMTAEQRSQGFELPSLLNIGASYDVHFGSNAVKNNRITFAGNFTSHSFSEDQFGLGVEYSYKDYVMIRGGYNYQNGLTDVSKRVTALTGISGGISFMVPLKKNGPQIGLDYAYQTSNPWSGSHTVGVRINL